MKKWRFHILATTFHFQVVSTDEDLFWKTATEREDYRSKFAAIVRTALQRIIEIGRYKAQKELKMGKMSSQAIAKIYVDNLHMGEGAEPITEKYVSVAMRIHDTLLAVQGIKDVMFALDAMLDHASPFNSVYRLECFMLKTRDPAQLIWAFNSVYDLYMSGVFSHERGMSVESLSGGKAGKGDVDLWLMKMRLHEHLLGPFLEKNTFKTDVKTQVRKVFVNHAAYRQWLKPYEATEKAELSWCAGWAPSSLKLIELIEDLTLQLDSAIGRSSPPGQAGFNPRARLSLPSLPAQLWSTQSRPAKPDQRNRNPRCYRFGSRGLSFGSDETEGIMIIRRGSWAHVKLNPLIVGFCRLASLIS